MMDLSELKHLRYGAQIPIGSRVSTVLADFDFETYSEAGYVWDEVKQKWGPLPGVAPQNRGLPSVGVVRYTEDRTFEPLMMWYDLKDGQGARYWQPGMANPQPLFDHLAAGRLLSAWNVGFEERVWTQCRRLYGWPALPYMQLRCDMAKSRAWGRPGKLDKACEVAQTTAKDKAGADLMKVFSMPQTPTKKQPLRRIHPGHDPERFGAYQNYGRVDIESEAHVSAVTPDLSPIELEYWQVDQSINRRGVRVDIKLIDAAIGIIGQAHERYGVELGQLTGGIKATELEQLKGWCAAMGYTMQSMDEEHVEAALKDLKTKLHDGRLATVYRVLELRSFVGSSSVKKVFAMRNQASDLAQRLHDIFSFHAARTGRPTGNGPQPTNLPKAGPDVWKCACGRHYGRIVTGGCPWCGRSEAYRVDSKGFFAPAGSKPHEWSPAAAADAFEVLDFGDLDILERFFGEGMLTIAGCLRGLFIAAEGHDFVSSDFTAIEAVILACMAGEQWRIDLFREGGKIYEKSGSLITNIPYEDILAYKAQTGQHHPARQTGKTGELGLGYQGWVGAWRAFDDSGTLSDQDIKKIILAWRDASPAIVEFWGGQSRRQGYGQPLKWENFGVEGAFIDAILNPGKVVTFRKLGFQLEGEVLYITLPSGRQMAYHKPALRQSDKFGCRYAISYWGWNSNDANGPKGWVQIDTWGGRLVENIVQAIGNDILRFASVNLERAGYPIVLHVYDEIVAEVPEGFGSIENFEAWMGYMPDYAVCDDGKPWPISAAGGWRDKRYRKG